MSPPNDLRFLETHEWHRQDGDTITIGISQIAADELTDITYVVLPKIGDKITANGRFGEVESVKATSDLYSGVAGTVTSINTELNTQPGLVNSDPYNSGWMIKLQSTNATDFDKLLTTQQYLKKTGH